MSVEPQEEKKGGSKKTILIVFIILLAAFNGFQIWLQMDTVKKHEVAIVGKDAKIDTIRAEAVQLLADLQASKDQAEHLGLDTTELGNQIRELQVLNKKLNRTKNIGWSKYNAIKGQIAGLKELLLQKDLEIALKDSTINMQKADIDTLNVEKND